jgi:hypothetical protein
MSDHPTANPVQMIVDRIEPLLAGHHPGIQGAALADPLATWLAGHVIRDDPIKTDALRERLLTVHLDCVRKLVPVNAAIIHGEDGP